MLSLLLILRTLLLMHIAAMVIIESFSLWEATWLTLRTISTVGLIIMVRQDDEPSEESILTCLRALK